jgi:dTDP-4-dehydrorhamnose reductase
MTQTMKPNPLRILLTGATGQVGTEFRRRAGAFQVLAPTRSEFDLASPETLGPWLRAQRPGLIINAGAYTAVDRAEDEEALAMRVNALAVEALAAYADEADVPLLQLSTDYVFDGEKTTPYTETDAPRPLGVYGRSKAEGEIAARAARRHAIIRLSWVFASHGSNFVRTMLRLATERPRLRVVADQQGGPTWAGHAAECLVTWVEAHAAGRTPAPGTWHLESLPHVSWYTFAREILAQAQHRGLLGTLPAIEAIASHEFPTRARRPANSRLDGALTQAALGVRAPDWRDGLSRTLDELARRSLRPG